jgi:uncharacterized membrane protein
VDPYPFILLNVFLSMIAELQTILPDIAKSDPGMKKA